MIDIEDGVQFDPGFIQHISAFEPNIEYVYNTKLKNFRQLFFDKTVHARILLQIFIGAILCK